MNSIAILQARTNSQRLPGKVLLPISGIPIVILAAKRAANKGQKVIVAIPEESSDDELALTLQNNGIPLFRGSLEDPLDRIVNALPGLENDSIVFRLTSDNVFPDGNLLDEIEKEFLERGLQYLCCNGTQSGLPYGMSAEIMWLKCLRDAAAECSNSSDREHVTPYIRKKYGRAYFEKYKELRKGHFRCTIDCFDDYLSVRKVFESVKDPINISVFDLIPKLEKTIYQPIDKAPVPQLLLGGAQLGMNYGINNKVGKPNNDLCKNMIKTALANGVRYIDTARSYKNSEEVIGNVLKDGWTGRCKIITKLSSLTDCPVKASKSTVKAFVNESIYKSCLMLGLQQLDVVLLHRASHLVNWNGAAWDSLLELKATSVIKNLGVSIQNPKELKHALSVREISYIQMPFNILDSRWNRFVQNIVSTKTSRNIVIHVRSALLQGLLSSDEDYHWKGAGIKNHEPIRQWLHDTVSSCNRVSVIDLCLSYVRTMDWIDGIIVGMEKIEQLEENIKYFNSPVLNKNEINDINKTRPQVSEKSLNPAMWAKE